MALDSMDLVFEACSRLRLGPYRLEQAAAPPAITYGLALDSINLVFEVCSRLRLGFYRLERAVAPPALT